jgi:hypothetical protein
MIIHAPVIAVAKIQHANISAVYAGKVCAELKLK